MLRAFTTMASAAVSLPGTIVGAAIGGGNSGNNSTTSSVHGGGGIGGASGSKTNSSSDLTGMNSSRSGHMTTDADFIK
jgi:hypothetical protein